LTALRISVLDDPQGHQQGGAMAKVTRLSCGQDVSHTADWLDDQPVSVPLPDDEATALADL
jgi:hypothetical protein